MAFHPHSTINSDSLVDANYNYSLRAAINTASTFNLAITYLSARVARWAVSGNYRELRNSTFYLTAAFFLCASPRHSSPDLRLLDVNSCEGVLLFEIESILH